jgi:hypothetical protein
MSNKLKLTILLLTIGLGAALFFTFRRNETDIHSLSLSFQRYSNLLDPQIQSVGFFWLTNASDKPFLVCMTGGSNTLVLDTMFMRYKGKPKESYMVNCAFSDQTLQGWTNWEQMPSPSRGRNTFVQLAPHSGLVIRAPLPTNGQKRKVAVLCEAPLAGWRQSPFWSSGFGKGLLPMLPRSILRRLAEDRPKVLKIWCDRELSNPGESFAR